MKERERGRKRRRKRSERRESDRQQVDGSEICDGKRGVILGFSAASGGYTLAETIICWATAVSAAKDDEELMSVHGAADTTDHSSASPCIL